MENTSWMQEYEKVRRQKEALESDCNHLRTRLQDEERINEQLSRAYSKKREAVIVAEQQAQRQAERIKNRHETITEQNATIERLRDYIDLLNKSLVDCQGGAQ